ncbi:hypothetical protein KRX52_04450 [Pseudomonas sp. MAP12]|uniref:Uncharacterized protein n=1 Tax=Geopseudomonas aromaticivorans TaxID=2849492 RepID=A0ABS6MUW5_9GAMM|nr:hypothetical protein [Pseudomonas aromaticivorans]MBV2132047.1 hypothetical protein [Pseudomonas aromaticivorans]
MNPLNQADQALLDRLRTILPANGYLTDIGNRVHAGYLGALLEAEEVTYPLITVQPDECPPPIQGSWDFIASLGRKVVGAADPGGGLDALNDIYCDLLRCLVTPEGIPSPWGRPGPHRVTFKAPQQFLADHEVPKGTVVIPLQLHTIINGE